MYTVRLENTSYYVGVFGCVNVDIEATKIIIPKNPPKNVINTYLCLVGPKSNHTLANVD